MINQFDEQSSKNSSQVLGNTPSSLFSSQKRKRAWEQESMDGGSVASSTSSSSSSRKTERTREGKKIVKSKFDRFTSYSTSSGVSSSSMNVTLSSPRKVSSSISLIRLAIAGSVQEKNDRQQQRAHTPLTFLRTDDEQHRLQTRNLNNRSPWSSRLSYVSGSSSTTSSTMALSPVLGSSSKTSLDLLSTTSDSAASIDSSKYVYIN